MTQTRPIRFSLLSDERPSAYRSRPSKFIQTGSLLLACWAFCGVASAAPLSLEGMGVIQQWTDLESQTDEMPSSIWGTSDATSEDRIGLHVEFENGLTGSITYSGVAGLWNTTNFSPLAHDTATGFFTEAGGLHYLINNTTTLPMAWDGFIMPYSGNFDLDYSNRNGSHFRASTSGWDSAVFTTYSSAASTVPEPSTFAMAAISLLGLVLYGWRRKGA